MSQKSDEGFGDYFAERAKERGSAYAEGRPDVGFFTFDVLFSGLLFGVSICCVVLSIIFERYSEWHSIATLVGSVGVALAGFLLLLLFAFAGVYGTLLHAKTSLSLTALAILVALSLWTSESSLRIEEERANQEGDKKEFAPMPLP